MTKSRDQICGLHTWSNPYSSIEIGPQANGSRANTRHSFYLTIPALNCHLTHDAYIIAQCQQQIVATETFSNLQVFQELFNW